MEKTQLQNPSSLARLHPFPSLLLDSNTLEVIQQIALPVLIALAATYFIVCFPPVWGAVCAVPLFITSAACAGALLASPVKKCEELVSQILYPEIDPKLPTIYYVNGIYNGLEDIVNGAETLKEKVGNVNVIPVYSPYEGVVFDLYKFAELKIRTDYQTPCVLNLRKELLEKVKELDKEKSPKKFFIVSFSRGALEVYHALKALTPEQRKHFIVIACGPATLLPDDIAYRVEHFISEQDWVAFCANGYWKVTSLISRGGVTVLKPLSKLKRLIGDHYFTSETYQTAICAYVKDCLKELASLPHNNQH